MKAVLPACRSGFAPQLLDLVPVTHQDKVDVFEAISMQRLHQLLDAAASSEPAVVEDDRRAAGDARRLAKG
jgi:hypothetical protein